MNKIKKVLKGYLPMLKWTFGIAAALIIIPQTVAPIYSSYIDLAFLKLPEAEAWMLGDLAAIFTVFTYVTAYALYEMIISAFLGAGEDDLKKAKAQDQAQDKTSSQNLSEA